MQVHELKRLKLKSFATVGGMFSHLLETGHLNPVAGEGEGWKKQTNQFYLVEIAVCADKVILVCGVRALLGLT